LSDVDADDVISGEAWDALTARIGALREMILDPAPDDAAVRGDGVRYLLDFLAAGLTVCVQHDDTDVPELGHMIHHRHTWGLDNPDCLYSYTRLRGGGTYRITGEMGTARHLELQVNTGHQSDGDFSGWRAVSALAGDDMVTDRDGRFEVVLSPDGKGPNGMLLDDTASFLLARQYLCDWEHERPTRVTIERDGGILPPPPTSAERMAARIGLLCDWLDSGARCWHDISTGILGSDPADVQPFLPPSEASGLKGQAYGMGAWRCEPDQAVVLELEPPTCRMWGVSLCDRFWQSIAFDRRQSSLNSAQATLDDDGTFRAVISHDDPGVANWLDPGGHREGTLAVRYLFAESLPALRYRTIARAELASHLPSSTSRVDATTRSEILRRRHRAVVQRYTP
jgi:hypothetical protein